MFNPSREQVRLFFCDAWKKHVDRLPLVGAEVTAADIAARHCTSPSTSRSASTSRPAFAWLSSNCAPAWTRTMPSTC